MTALRELGRLLDGLERGSLDVSEVDFLATTTCTGRLVPSLDAHLGGLPRQGPHVNRPDERLAGGRVAPVGGTPAAHLLYEWGGYRLSLFVMPAPLFDLPESHVHDERGCLAVRGPPLHAPFTAVAATIMDILPWP